jgi:RNA polymerase sigma-70 factor (ECF subfamily)
MTKKVDNLTDEELVDLVRSQDQELYIHLVHRYQDKLLRYARYLTQDPDMSQDVVQSTFIKAYQNLKGFNTKRKFSSWIYRICHNESINYLKKHAKEHKLDSDHWHNLPSNIDVEAELDQKQIKQLIKRNLESLPPKYRSVLTLYYLEDKKYEEIADILRVSSGTVATWISRGKSQLKQQIIQKGGNQ